MSRESSNAPFDRVLLDSLEVGRSTGEDVARILGAPQEVVQLGRRSAWRYDFVLAKRAGLFLLVIAFQNLDSRSDRVWVFFDEGGRLTHYGSRFEAEHTRWAMPWQALQRGEDEGRE